MATAAYSSPTTAPQLIAQADVSAIATAFVTDLSTGNYIAALERYDSDIQVTLSAESIAQEWEDILAESGEYQGISSVTVDSSSDTPIAIVTCQFENGTRDLSIVVNATSEVVSMDAVEG
jgi:hypothetical protein